MKSSILFNACMLLILHLILSCNKNEIVATNGTGVNIPSYASTGNALSYSINAQRLTDMQTIPLSFTKNRLQIAAAVSNVMQGQAVFTLLDRTNAVIHTDTFRLAGMYEIVGLTGLPSSIAVAFKNFTGSIQYALVGDTAVSVFNATDFPKGRGSQWTYFVYDSLAQRSDTLVVTVFGQTTLPGNIPATIWQHAYAAHVETLYVNTTQDTIRFYRYPNSTWEELNYVFPLCVGRGWRLSFADFSTVLQIGSVTTLAGTFPNAYLVRSSWAFLNDYQTLDSWLVPNVGIVKTHRAGVSFGMANVTWELMSYRVQ